MPKVKKVTARKDYPEAGVKKGEECYVWSLKTGRGGRSYRSKTPPKPSQLTTSEFLIEVYELKEEIDAASADSVDELQGMVDDWKSRIEEIRDSCQEKFDNMPEGLQQGDTGQLLEERVNAMDDWYNELDGVELSELEEDSLEGTDEEKAEQVQEHLNELLGEIQSIEPGV